MRRPLASDAVSFPRAAIIATGGAAVSRFAQPAKKRAAENSSSARSLEAAPIAGAVATFILDSFRLMLGDAWEDGDTIEEKEAGMIQYRCPHLRTSESDAEDHPGLDVRLVLDIRALEKRGGGDIAALETP